MQISQGPPPVKPHNSELIAHLEVGQSEVRRDPCQMNQVEGGSAPPVSEICSVMSQDLVEVGHAEMAVVHG